jgi:hypothetical protein
MIEEKNDYSDLLIEENLNEDLALEQTFNQRFTKSLEEDDMDPRLFSADVLYKRLGVDFIINKYKFKANDEVMYPLYEEMAANLLSPLQSMELIRTLNTPQTFDQIFTKDLNIPLNTIDENNGGENRDILEFEICD